MDDYFGFTKKPMWDQDQEHATFITLQGMYCYKAMPYRLENTSAMYKGLGHKFFKGQIGKNMELYIDEFIAKSKTLYQHLLNLRELFDTQ